MKRELTLEAQDYLTRVQDLMENGPHSPQAGICFNLQSPVPKGTGLDCYSMVSLMAIGWNGITTIDHFPVKPVTQIDYWEGEQGELRRSLLEHIKDRLIQGDLTNLVQQLNDYWDSKL